MKKIACLILLLVSIISCGNYNANHTGPNGEIRTTSEDYCNIARKRVEETVVEKKDETV